MSTEVESRSRSARVALWALTVADAAAMGAAGMSKFANPAGWTSMFEGWGYPPSFAFVIGAAEVVLAFVLLVPRFAAYAAAGLILIMLGALGTVLLHPGPMGPVPPLAHVVALGIILAARWRSRWRPDLRQLTGRSQHDDA